MEAVKAFFAKDIVKIVAGGVFLIVNGLILKYVSDTNMQVTLISVWTSIGVWLGIASGGTSNLRSNASNAQVTALTNNGVLPPKA